MKQPKSAVRSKSDRLPIAVADRDRIALECYLALSTLQSGQGDPHALAVLTHALVAAYFLLEASVSDGGESRAAFAAAQEAINQCDSDAVIAGRCVPATAVSAGAIGALLALYDRQLRRPMACVDRLLKREKLCVFLELSGFAPSTG